MSIFDKKFRALLAGAPEHQKLQAEVVELKQQVAALGSALSTVMKAYSDMAKVVVDHRKSLEEIYSYLTDPLEYEPVNQEGVAPEMTPEQLAKYKRSLN